MPEQRPEIVTDSDTVIARREPHQIRNERIRMDEQEIITVEPEIRLGVLAIKTPEDMVKRASEVATALAKVVNDQKLYSVISGKKFVRVEGWSTLGSMLGVIPREVSVIENDGDYEAVVELVRVTDGAIVGRGSAIVGADEKTWAGRAKYARRSMALTRATGKAYRLGFSWIMNLAGYEPTPAEEMSDELGPKWDKPSDDNNGNGKTEPVVRSVIWPADAITWAVKELGVKPQQAVGALNQSQHLPHDATLDEIKHWLSVRKVERDAGAEGAEATGRADADYLTTHQGV